MKKIAVLVVFMMASSPALAEEFYVGGYLGLAAVDSSKLRVAGGGPTFTFDTEPGFNAGVMIGTFITDNLRVEGEIVYSVADGQQIDSTPVDGSIIALSLGTNLIYDFSGDGIRPYAGGGMAVVAFDAASLNIAGNRVFEGAATTGGLQVILGVTIPLESVTLFADYRGLMTAPVKFTDAGGTGLAVTMDSYVRNSLMFGVRTGF